MDLNIIEGMRTIKERLQKQMKQKARVLIPALYFFINPFSDIANNEKNEIVTKSQKPFLYQLMDQKNSVNKRSLKNISNESTHTKGIAIIAHIYSNILNIFCLEIIQKILFFS